MDYHFVAFVEKDGNLYDLDGRKPGPLNCGSTSKETFLKVIVLLFFYLNFFCGYIYILFFHKCQKENFVRIVVFTRFFQTSQTQTTIIVNSRKSRFQFHEKKN